MGTYAGVSPVYTPRCAVASYRLCMFSALLDTDNLLSEIFVFVFPWRRRLLLAPNPIYTGYGQTLMFFADIEDAMIFNTH